MHHQYMVVIHKIYQGLNKNEKTKLQKCQNLVVGKKTWPRE